MFLLFIYVSSVWIQTVTNVLGPDVHAQISGKIHLVQFDSEGVFGWIPLHEDFVNPFLSGDNVCHVDYCPFLSNDSPHIFLCTSAVKFSKFDRNVSFPRINRKSEHEVQN